MDFKHCASCGFAFNNFRNPDRAECVRRYFFQCARTCISGCQRFHAAERSGPGLDDNIVRYVNSPVMHDAVHAQHEPLLFHDGVPFALPAPTKSIRFLRLRDSNLSHSKRRYQDQEQSAAWYAPCGTHHCWRQTPPLRGNVVPTRLQEQQDV